jgi:predicted DNA-binding transcriptional regulator YafY
MRGVRLHRLIRLIALLRGPTAWNARKLGEHFRITPRNLRRDLEILRLAGVPFYHDPDFGQFGGYRIKESYFFPSIGLNDQECLDLAVLTRVAETQTIPLLDRASEVRDKLLTSLSSEQQKLIREATELFDILSVGIAEHRHCRDVMTALQKALLAGVQIEGIYDTPHEGRPRKLKLEPRRVFLCGQAWYLVARDCLDKTDKLYRLARFREIKLLSKKCACADEGFSIREFLGNAWSVHRGDRDWNIEIHFDRKTAPLISEVNWHQTQVIEPHTDGSITFKATVSGLDEVKFWVLRWGAGAKVIRPRELQLEVRKILRQCLDFYEPGNKP